MDTEFLDRLAKVLKTGKCAACQRAVGRILAWMKQRFDAGEFDSPSKAELAFRELVANELSCEK